MATLDDGGEVISVRPVYHARRTVFPLMGFWQRGALAGTYMYQVCTVVR